MLDFQNKLQFAWKILTLLENERRLIKLMPSILYLAISFLIFLYVITVSFEFASVTPLGATHKAKMIHLPAVDETLQFQGNLIAHTNSHIVTKMIFTITKINTIAPIDLNKLMLQIDYRDQYQRLTNLTWTWDFPNNHAHDDFLEAGESLRLTIPISNVLETHLGSNTPFAIDITPPHGAVLIIQRTMPPRLDTIMTLD